MKNNTTFGELSIGQVFIQHRTVWKKVWENTLNEETTYDNAIFMDGFSKMGETSKCFGKDEKVEVIDYAVCVLKDGELIPAIKYILDNVS